MSVKFKGIVPGIWAVNVEKLNGLNKTLLLISVD